MVKRIFCVTCLIVAFVLVMLALCGEPIPDHYENGYKAGKNGSTIKDCPFDYENEANRHEWHLGFYEATKQ